MLAMGKHFRNGFPLITGTVFKLPLKTYFMLIPYILALFGIVLVLIARGLKQGVEDVS
jgi:hypothetical protein